MFVFLIFTFVSSCQNEVLSEERQLMKWVGIFRMGNLRGEGGVPVGSLIGGNFLDGNFPGGTFLEPFFLKVRLPPFKKICFICFNESPLKS